MVLANTTNVRRLKRWRWSFSTLREPKIPSCIRNGSLNSFRASPDLTITPLICWSCTAIKPANQHSWKLERMYSSRMEMEGSRPGFGMIGGFDVCSQDTHCPWARKPGHPERNGGSQKAGVETSKGEKSSGVSRTRSVLVVAVRGCDDQGG